MKRPLLQRDVNWLPIGMMKTHRLNQLSQVLFLTMTGLAVAGTALAAEGENSDLTTSSNSVELVEESLDAPAVDSNRAETREVAEESGDDPETPEVGSNLDETEVAEESGVDPETPEVGSNLDETEVAEDSGDDPETPEVDSNLDETGVAEASPETPEAPEDTDDIMIQTGDDSPVTSLALATSVTGNSVNLSGTGPNTLDANIQLSGSNSFNNMYGVNTIAMNSGVAGVQNINISVGGNIDMAPSTAAP